MDKKRKSEVGVLYLRKLVAEIRRGLEARFELLVLNSAIVIPDICGGAETPGKRNGKARYKRWYAENVDEGYTKLQASTAYDLRCTLLHEGRGGSPAMEREVMIYTFPHDSPCAQGIDIVPVKPVVSSCGKVEGERQPHKKLSTCNTITLCTALADACENWLEKVKDDQDIQERIVSMMRLVKIRDYLSFGVKSSEYGYLFENPKSGTNRNQKP